MTTAAIADAADTALVRTKGAKPKYFLAKHVFCCFEGDYVVLLDLRRDKYLSVRRDQIAALGISMAVADLSAPRAANTLTMSAELASASPDASEFVRQGLVTADADACNPAVPTRVHPPTLTLRDMLGENTVQWATRGRQRKYFLDFILSSAHSSAALRCLRLESVVNGVLRGQATASHKAAEFDFERCADIVSTFEQLRPIVPRNYLCLFDSLALLKMLMRNDLRPRWVFGVQMSPFAAHCWLQLDSVVLNDSVEEVSAYTPIMVV